MAGAILNPPAPKLAAGTTVVALRMPTPPKQHTGNPFTSVGDIVLECDGVTDGKQCGWGCAGPRAHAKRAYDDHRKLYHSTEIGVVLLNRPRQ